jgi:hypothetical protein
VLGGVRQQRDVARPLQGNGERPLVTSAGAGLAAGLDLAALREVAAQSGDVLVVDVADLIDAERTDFSTRRVLAGVFASTTTSAAAPTAWLSGWHWLFSTVAEARAVPPRDICCLMDLERKIFEIAVVTGVLAAL